MVEGRPPRNPIRRNDGISVRVRIGFTAALLWGVVLMPLAIVWQNAATYYAAIVPASVFMVSAVVFMLRTIWTEA